MSMLKIISPGSQRWNESVAELIKLASNGLRGNDLQAFIKRAGHPFVDILRNTKFEPGEVPIHLIALGATELYGPNRNGDGFKIAACRLYHNTFVKHARWYRNHKNKDRSKSYGIIKASVFNEPMKRIELLVALNGTKEAAERNGGLIAEQELEKLAQGKDIGVSMACKVAYDVCSGCGNRARNRDEYCKGVDEGGMCKRGGLRNRITMVCDDGHHLHADNPHPDFFDISDVWRPADRIAYVFGKAASGSVMSGAEMADEIGLREPLDFLINTVSPHLGQQIKYAYYLAEAENRLKESNSLGYGSWARAFDPSIQSPIDGLDDLNHRDRAKALNALASQKIAMPLRDFLRMVLGENAEKCAALANNVSRYLPGIFNRMIENVTLEDILINNPYKASGELATLSRQIWAEKLAASYSLAREHVNKRVLRSAIRTDKAPAIKLAGTHLEPNDRFEKLAMQYALYKIAFMCDIAKDEDLQLTADLLVRQNYI